LLKMNAARTLRARLCDVTLGFADQVHLYSPAR
jgi:hypothetical protein